MLNINTTSSLCAATVALLFCSSPLAAQLHGGNAQTLARTNGEGYFSMFGNALADAGDVNGDGISDVIVGANTNTVGAAGYEGSAYVYSGRNGALLHQFDGATRYAAMGDAVAGLGDIDGDNFGDVLVCAPGPWQDDLGVSYIYSGRTGLELYQITDAGGHACTPLGDLNMDGITDFAISKLDGGTSSEAIGEVSVFSGANGSRLWRMTGSINGSRFGASLANAGDLDNDGYNDLIIGEPYSTGVATTYVISGRTGSTIHLLQPPTNLGIYFGWSVASAGDFNGDQVPDILIGAPAGVGLGAVFLYSGADGSLLHQLDAASTGIHFGESVCGLGDITGDGVPDLAVGAPTWSGNQAQGGAVFLFSGRDFSILHQWSDFSFTENFGSTLALLDDLNGDGAKEIAMGAPRATHGQNTYAGSTFVCSFKPMIFASTPTVSAASGGVVNFNLAFLQEAADYDYQILVSATGIGPFLWGELSIPLTQDFTVIRSMMGIYSFSIHTGMSGTLDSAATASASATIPSGLPSAVIGRKFWCAAIAREAGNLPKFSSSSLMVEITP